MRSIWSLIKPLKISSAAEQTSAWVFVCVVGFPWNENRKTETQSATFSGTGMYLTYICSETCNVDQAKTLPLLFAAWCKLTIYLVV